VGLSYPGFSMAHQRYCLQEGGIHVQRIQVVVTVARSPL